MNPFADGAAKRLLLSLAAASSLTGCAVYDPGYYPAAPYYSNSYPYNGYSNAYPYSGGPYVAPPVYVQPPVYFNFGFWGGHGHHHGGHHGGHWGGGGWHGHH